MSNARNLADLLGTSTKSNQVISTSGAVTTTGAFTSVGIDDNADATALSIDSSEVVQVENGVLKLKSDNATLHFRRTTSETDIAKIQYVHANPSLDIGGDGKNVRFINGSSFAETMRVGTNGNITIQDGDLVIGTAGHGIDFSATGDGFAAAGSELLDDYEEGAYNLSFNGFSQQTVSQGWYTKVGRLCYVTTFIHASGSQNSNNFTCSLPFTPASHSASNNSGYYIGSIGPVMHYRVDTGTAGLVTYVTAGTATFRLYEVNTDGDWYWITNNQFSSEDQAWISFTYVTAS
tara:strand:+ start:60 stop:932 length:873 start_codon:yes stop_codon:yes gene_type:complete